MFKRDFVCEMNVFCHSVAAVVGLSLIGNLTSLSSFFFLFLLSISKFLYLYFVSFPSLSIYLYPPSPSLSPAPPLPSRPSLSACMTESLPTFFILALKSPYVSAALTTSRGGGIGGLPLSQSHPDTWVKPGRTTLKTTW